MLESAETELAAAGGAGTLAGMETTTTDGTRKKRLGVVAWIAIIWLVIVVGAAILAPVLPIKDPINGYDYLNTKAGLFKAGHIFGTDDSGNDVFSRVIWGAQASLLIGVGSVVFGTLIGGFLGLFAGFKGGIADTVISAFFNIFLAFPQLVLALTLVSVFSPPGSSSARWSHRIGIVILAVGIVSVPILGRITRANTLAWSQREFVMAARAQGATDMRVMFREVLPNVVPAMLSIALLSVAVVIVLEGALAIFGLSIPAPSPSWGNMIQSQISNPNSAPTVWMVPSALILLTVLSLNYLGDIVRAKFDVREAAI
ncbi:MAG: peptide/nickel transport system permease protein [Actinomycetota bacterium]|nr:peptide/nickel transport system permease protein [Actinomycetota bacterium]